MGLHYENKSVWSKIYDGKFDYFEVDEEKATLVKYHFKIFGFKVTEEHLSVSLNDIMFFDCSCGLIHKHVRFVDQDNTLCIKFLNKQEINEVKDLVMKHIPNFNGLRYEDKSLWSKIFKSKIHSGKFDYFEITEEKAILVKYHRRPFRFKLMKGYLSISLNDIAFFDWSVGFIRKKNYFWCTRYTLHKILKEKTNKRS